MYLEQQSEIRARIRNTAAHLTEEVGVVDTDREEVFAWTSRCIRWERRLRELEAVADSPPVASEVVLDVSAEQPLQRRRRAGSHALAL